MRRRKSGSLTAVATSMRIAAKSNSRPPPMCSMKLAWPRSSTGANRHPGVHPRTVNTTPVDPYASRMLALADDLWRRRVIRSPAVHAAFASVRRDQCVCQFLVNGQQVTVGQDHTTPPAKILDCVYSDVPLMTRDRDVPSSSSAPSTVGRMLEAADLAPGMRVAEVGAGSGWNAALIHHITSSMVVTMDTHGPTATAARASIHRLGLDRHVTIMQRDGYLAAPEHGPYDRIIVTCGIAGVPPGWLDQLAPEGRILAPVRHGGVHPIIAVTADRRCHAALGADFMLAAGPLYPPALAGRDQSSPWPARPIVWSSTAMPPIQDHQSYNDLWFYLAARDNRIGRAFMDTPDFDFGAGQLALLSDPDAAWVQKTGKVTSSCPKLGEQLAALTAEWVDEGCPGITGWTGSLVDAAGLANPLAIPSEWRHSTLYP